MGNGGIFINYHLHCVSDYNGMNASLLTKFQVVPEGVVHLKYGTLGRYSL